MYPIVVWSIVLIMLCNPLASLKLQHKRPVITVIMLSGVAALTACFSTELL